MPSGRFASATRAITVVRPSFGSDSKASSSLPPVSVKEITMRGAVIRDPLTPAVVSSPRPVREHSKLEGPGHSG